MEPLWKVSFLHDRHDSHSSRNTLAALSLCLAVLLFINNTSTPEGAEGRDYIFRTKHLGSTDSTVSMRRTVSEPQFKLGGNKKRPSGKMTNHSSWYTRRQNEQLDSFFAEMNFMPPPATKKKPRHSQEKGSPSLASNDLPETESFRTAPPGWQSIMGSDKHFQPSQIRSLSLTDITRLISYAHTGEIDNQSINSGIRDVMEKAATSVVTGTPSMHATIDAPRGQKGSTDALLVSNLFVRLLRPHDMRQERQAACIIRLLHVLAFSTTAENDTSLNHLQFCAALRIMADWRVMRQIPEHGYSTYGAGIKLGHKDVILNVKKIENAARAWMERRKSGYGSVQRRPTLRDLLLEEIDSGRHLKLPKLEDDSAAVGLLWARRQLEYQQKIYLNTNNPRFVHISDAVRNAYLDVYSKYHGWTVRKVFELSANAAPPIAILIEQMTSKDMEHGKQQMAHFSRAVQPLLDDSLQLLFELNMHDEGKA